MVLLSPRLCGPPATLRISQGSTRPRRTAPRASQNRGRGSASSSKQPWGNSNRLGPSDTPAPLVAGVAAPHHGDPTRGPPNAALDRLRLAWSDLVGQAMYRYFNWRQDTWSDLQLLVVANLVIVSAGAALQARLAAALPTSAEAAAAAAASGVDAAPQWWTPLYRVLVVVLGQDLPEEADGFALQVFGVATAVLGLASFALVLALIEQVVLEVLEGNVRRGSRVFESGHYLVLAWGESARDLGQVNRILLDLCAASRNEGGTVIVVLVAHREKLELESLFREAVPPERRYGSQLVFRQGSPLDPGALALAAAPDAKAVIVCGDYSRPAQDSDDQVLRCAVLLDEMVAAAAAAKAAAAAAAASSAADPAAAAPPRGPVVVAEVQ